MAMDEDLLNDFERCAADAAADEVRMAVLVARTLDSDVRDAAVRAQFDQLTGRRAAGQSPWEFLRDQAFAGNALDYAALDNSNIAWVLDNRRGIPITLAVVLIHVARAAGRRATGLNFPGHFLVQIDEEIVDPFIMTPVTRQALIEGLPPGTRGQPASALFAPASTLAVGLRMLNNVKHAHLNAAAWHRALDIVDAQLRLAPRQSALHLEQGDLWVRLGVAQPARAAYETALRHAGESTAAAADELRRAVAMRLGQLGDASDTIH
jgi:regulator of sirC expression with transglutaminase-like and TPR domain